MFRSILLLIVFVACLANWVILSVAAKVTQETTTAVVGLSALLALAAALICDGLREVRARAQKHAEEQQKILLALHSSLERQNEILTTLVQQSEVLVASTQQAGADAQKLRERSTVHLHNIDAAAEHTNALLQWIGEQKG
jgi:hypothetical protein